MRAVLAQECDSLSAKLLFECQSVSLVSSELFWLEADRTVVRLAAQGLNRDHLSAQVEACLARTEMTVIDREVIRVARGIPEVVKSLDAIHIATALILADSIATVVTYDAKMASVLGRHGVPAMTASQAIETFAIV
jgi:predicted nucleic acid-binding protein